MRRVGRIGGTVFFVSSSSITLRHGDTRVSSAREYVIIIIIVIYFITELMLNNIQTALKTLSGS